MKWKNASILTILLAFAASCAHEPAVQELPITASPNDEVTKLENDVNQAVADQVNVLSPDNFKRAKDNLEEAKESLRDNDDAKKILHEVSVARAYLTRAQDTAKATTDAMSDVVSARQLALKEGAKEAFSEDFAKADRDLTNLTKDVEEGDRGDVGKRRGELQARYMDLELRAIRRNALNVAEGKVNQAKRDGAGKLAPRTLEIAEKSIKDAEAYIIANRHNTEEIKKLSDKAMADADHVVKITNTVKDGTTVATEEAALALEAEQQKTAAAQEKLKSAQAQLEAQSATTASLEKDKAFQQRFAEAQAMFTPDEAEVYRQGDNLVIRLKGLEFNQAQANLKGENFPLLAKVQSVIEKFNAGQVVVEGHTDSRGSKAVNSKLSQARADAVKSYLQSNQPNAADVQFSSVGYGFQKPLATNKTAEGRAQNRRVDVVIRPQAM